VYQAGAEAAEAFFNFNAEDFEDVDGVGDGAHWNRTLGLVEALEGDYYASMTIFDVDSEDEENLDNLKTLLSTALSRLP
jgi:hypothetical protein